ncbi:MAG TPA: hypothetical protein VHY09_08515 [Candidatus Methylacidiphilales bacterium]|jgi:hypothetical protein|nr:hypothetical protein [Candidatus Methylacidiphilales bacterium]
MKIKMYSLIIVLAAFLQGPAWAQTQTPPAPAKLSFTLPDTASIDMQDPNAATHGSPYVLTLNEGLNELSKERVPGNAVSFNSGGLSGVIFSVTGVPEPKSGTLTMIALAAIAALRWRRCR